MRISKIFLFSFFGLLSLIVGCGSTGRIKPVTPVAGPAIPVRAAVVEFQDERLFGQGYNAVISMIPLSPFGGYFIDRHDAIYSSATEPFPQLVGKQVTERLDKSGLFSEVTYIGTQTPALGEYDVLVKGRINMLRAKGGVTRYGLSILGDLLWELGIPNRSRKWEIDVDYQLQNAYTGEPIGEPFKVEMTTGRAIFTQYSNRGVVPDLENKTWPMYDKLIAYVEKDLEPSNSKYWTELRADGERIVAQKLRDEETARRGSPPVFSFLAPADDETVRQAAVPVRWSITAPGGLKTAILAVNGQGVDIGINPMSLATDEGAPRSVAAREVSVPLKFGTNKLEALVADHRGNETRAELEITRLPRELVPARRHALLIGAGSTEAKDAVDLVRQALVDPMGGQFAPDSVTLVQVDSIDAAALEQAFSAFGNLPLAEDLAFVYIAAPGNWSDLTFAGVPFNDLTGIISRSLATSQVVLLADINWTGGPSEQELGERAEEPPAGWAMFVSQAKGERTSHGSFANVVKNVFAGQEGSSRLTIERFMDQITDSLSAISVVQFDSRLYGRRYNRSNTMAERE